MPGRSRLHAPLLAAVALSAAAHAAVVLMAASREPVGAPRGAPTQTMQARLVQAPAVRSALVEGTAPAPITRSDRSSPAVRPSEPHGTPPPDTASALDSTPDDTVADRRAKPLTYPVISLPADDDPRRVGLVRLMLVVSSEGRVVKTVVTAATLSQDYVDRITESFEAVRFEPATAHGLPRASWYEVVVDFGFDPEAHSSI